VGKGKGMGGLKGYSPPYRRRMQTTPDGSTLLGSEEAGGCMFDGEGVDLVMLFRNMAVVT
jgi:hypothetical protein